eukprot:scaffold2844_cov326-Pavlova_lutheri.AAC.12
MSRTFRLGSHPWVWNALGAVPPSPRGPFVSHRVPPLSFAWIGLQSKRRNEHACQIDGPLLLSCERTCTCGVGGMVIAPGNVVLGCPQSHHPTTNLRQTQRFGKVRKADK